MVSIDAFQREDESERDWVYCQQCMDRVYQTRIGDSWMCENGHVNPPEKTKNRSQDARKEN